MSAKLRIPAQHLKGLRELIDLSEEERRAFTDAAQSEPPTLDVDGLGDRIAATAGIDPDKTRRFIDLLINLHGAREGLDLSVEESVSELHHAMESLDKPIKPTDWQAFEKDLERLLSPEASIALTSKAVILIREHPQVYFSGRVLTDLRPIFGSSVDDTPAALIAVHTLKLSYFRDSDINEFFVAMDRADIVALIDILGRALKKEDALRHLTDGQHMRLLEVRP